MDKDYGEQTISNSKSECIIKAINAMGKDVGEIEKRNIFRPDINVKKMLLKYTYSW